MISHDMQITSWSVVLDLWYSKISITVEALVSDHLRNSEKRLKLELDYEQSLFPLKG